MSTNGKTNVFNSYKTGKTYKIFHQLTCKSQAIIYLLQSSICFIQYVGKSGTTFNLRLNNHRKDSKKKDAILACTHFQKLNHIFQRDAKFVLEQTTKKYNTIEEIRLIFKKQENFWILNLHTLYCYYYYYYYYYFYCYYYYHLLLNIWNRSKTLSLIKMGSHSIQMV